MADYLVPQDIMLMANYFGVDLENDEYYLLPLMWSAAAAPLLPYWQEMEDDKGSAVFFNQRTGVTQAQHPLDYKFMAQLKLKRRQGPPSDNLQRVWMQFSRDGTKYYYNFKTKETRSVMAAKLVLKPLPAREVPKYDMHMVDQLQKVRNRTVSTKNKVKNLEVLKFSSWWLEDMESEDLTFRQGGEHYGGGLQKRHLDLWFNLKTQLCDVHLRDSKQNVEVHNLSQVTGPNGKPIQCWDLKIGARLDILGRDVELKRADLLTGLWFEHHTKQLIKKKNKLVDMIQNYAPQSFPDNLISTKGDLQHGGVCIRQLMVQLERLCQILQPFRPAIVEEIQMWIQQNYS